MRREVRRRRPSRPGVVVGAACAVQYASTSSSRGAAAPASTLPPPETSTPTENGEETENEEFVPVFDADTFAGHARAAANTSIADTTLARPHAAYNSPS